MSLAIQTMISSPDVLISASLLAPGRFAGRAALEEGRAMGHCVGTYAPAVRQGKCLIVSICLRARGEVLRSTAEIEPRTFMPHQHRGPGNAVPHPLCKRALHLALLRVAGLR